MFPACNIPSKREAQATQICARTGSRAGRQDKGNRRKNPVADGSPAFPSLEDGVQEVGCKIKVR